MPAAVEADQGERAARFRAARGYKGLRNADVADAFGVPRTVVENMASGRKPLSDQDLEQMADICGVPVEFMRVGFTPLKRKLSPTQLSIHELLERIEELEQRLASAPRVDAVLAVDDGQGRRILGLPDDILDQLRGVIAETVDQRLAESDAASTRFAASARREAQQQAERPSEAPAAPSDVDGAAEGTS